MQINLNKLLQFVVLALPLNTFACDLCSIYSSIESTETAKGAVRFSVAEQFTSFGTLRMDGEYLENTKDQYLESSITQLIGSYDLNDNLTLQFALPYINRRFSRFDSGAKDKGTEAGIGDMTMLAKYGLIQERHDDEVFVIQLFGGIKLPTGDTDRIAEEGNHHAQEESPGSDHSEDMPEMPSEDHSGHVMHAAAKHGGVIHGDDVQVLSGIHGHDLALGSGSYDFPVGLNLFAERGRTFVFGTFQYTFKTEGDYSYEYADDFQWQFGPAYYVALDSAYQLAVKANFSGELKENDSYHNQKQTDAVRSVFAGPGLVLIAENLQAELAWDIPLDVDTHGLQAVPDYRLRLGLTYRF